MTALIGIERPVGVHFMTIAGSIDKCEVFHSGVAYMRSHVREQYRVNTEGKRLWNDDVRDSVLLYAIDAPNPMDREPPDGVEAVNLHDGNGNVWLFMDNGKTPEGVRIWGGYNDLGQMTVGTFDVLESNEDIAFFATGWTPVSRAS